MFDHYSGNRNKELQEYVFRMAYLAEIIEWDNRSHLERIRRYCHVIGEGTKISLEENEIISIASQLHDVGKANTPEVLSKKAGNYEDYEWMIIQRHTMDGARILEGSRSPYLTMAEAIALTHHERWDGSGYPSKIKGEAIPLGGRICAIADVFDALTTLRSYKLTVGINEAFKLISQSGGKLFDPHLVKVFETKYDEIVRIKQAYID